MALDPTLPRRHGARTRLRGRAGMRFPRLPLRLLLALALLGALGYGGWMWLRDSSLAAVRDVEVTGSTSSEGGRRGRDALDASRPAT